jgi:hypothetical protein
MANTMKKGAERLREIAGTAAATPAASTPAAPPSSKSGKDTMMIGAHFPRTWRRALAQVQIDPRNDGKKINDLLAEALTDLFAKYGITPPV